MEALDRREFVAGAAAGYGALILGGVALDPAHARRPRRRRTPFARGGAFSLGVAAGAPFSRTGTVVWTRLDGFNRDRLLKLEVARDPEFRRVVHRRNVRARANADHTVETRLLGRFMQPGREYFYRFYTRNAESPVGRFRTLPPPDSREPVRVGFFSCQDYQAGYYNAHAAMAKEDLDLVVSLGDYMYEKTFYQGPPDRRDTLGANRDGEVQTLPEYRAKYRLYRSDRNLQAMHAAHPFVAIWDDHEVEDNWAGGLPGDAADNRRIPFLARRENGWRAFFEYMPFAPVRNRPALGDFLYRRVDLGANAELFLLDQRSYRADQPCGDQLFAPCPEAESQPRNFLGRRQLAWLQRSLSDSDSTWKLIGSQLMVMALDEAPGQPINKDSWDGYGQERRELLGFVRERGIDNLAFLTGDIHTFFAGDVGVDGRGPESVATEFVGGSITSLGIPESVNNTTGAPLTKEQTELITRQVRVPNPHIRYDEQRSRGYAVLEARPDRLDVAFRGVDAMSRTPQPARTIGRFRVQEGSQRVQVL
jgi:alkaline phosphatase D